MGFGNHNSRIKVTIIVAIEQQEKTPPDNHSGMAIDRQRMLYSLKLFKTKMAYFAIHKKGKDYDEKKYECDDESFTQSMDQFIWQWELAF
ncbi:hypothetical protein OUZ56_022794 [Daphnia magna]|uniref:Uncharacterized protein n=1 Tax=Daphnia magna TaxID=35525 RepID=A0ABR0AXM1_9CRUS|nr:hypothetical protein OUZ56_022794 [Daphnia magna]